MRFAGAGQAEQGWTSTPHKPLNLSIGDIDWLGLQTQGTSRCLDPAPEPLSTVLCKIGWRGRDLNGPRRQGACACERLERFAQPRDWPSELVQMADSLQ